MISGDAIITTGVYRPVEADSLGTQCISVTTSQYSGCSNEMSVCFVFPKLRPIYWLLRDINRLTAAFLTPILKFSEYAEQNGPSKDVQLTF